MNRSFTINKISELMGLTSLTQRQCEADAKHSR
ncbi:hypothetical protein PATY110618_05075 [Paenibacillus typhae]|uniref:Uncharacterized protein n=1 Tax=Paenibacillus typhae TaxID=1174501 RepID=A0A1G8LI50_9BACL|nr:hypothetical protein SAMN05216192_106145 [Paenibacillus typhae]